MVEIQKPTSALKRPKLKHETFVVSSRTSMKKVTLVPNDEELVAISPERRNWRGILIALLVIAAVFSLIIFSIFLLTPEGEDLRIRGNRFTFNDILSKRFQWQPFNGTWHTDTELIYRDPNGGLSILNLVNYTIRVLMTNTTFRQLNADSFLLSPDLKYVLLQSDTNADGSRHHVYEVLTENSFPLGPSEDIAEAPHLQYVLWAPYPISVNHRKVLHNYNEPSSVTSEANNASHIKTNSYRDDLIKPEVLETSTFSTSNSKSTLQKIYNQAIAFVYENDIYYKPKVQGDVIYRITDTGQTGVIYNGVPDWTYANIPELDSRHTSMAFSPDGVYLAFITFNDTQVMEYKYTWMGEDLKYPAVLTQRYPKIGIANPKATVNIANLSVLNNIFVTQITLPNELLTDIAYIGALCWPTNNEISVIVTNRMQSQAATVFCKAPLFNCHLVYTENAINDGWVLPAEKPIFSSIRHHQYQENRTSISSTTDDNVDSGKWQNLTRDQNHTYEISVGSYLLKRLPVRDGIHGHFRHVVLISSLDRRAIPLTMGCFEVTQILGWDEPNEIVYFMAAPEKRPGERHLYKISLKLNITETNRTYITSTQPICLTCDNKPATFKLYTSKVMPHDRRHHSRDDDGIYRIPHNCLYNKIYFSDKFKFYIQECLGPESPSIYLVETQTNLKILILNDGNSLRHRLAHYALPQIRTFNVEIRHGFHAQVKLFLPPGMREDEEVAFPLVLQIDGAPGSQLVNERFLVTWNWYLCTQRSFIVAQVDGRGSGYQGELFRTQIHGKLGKVEVEDQLAVLTYLRDNLKFIDPSHICAYGWGYGGYTTIMTLADDSQQVLQCGIAINPITSFNYYYSFFTERYIPLKGDYIHALQDSDLTMRAGNIKGRNLMIMHSTADTMVHKEHSLMLVKALIDQEVKFRHQIYPDDDHYMTRSLAHVYQTMEWYFDECFGPSDDNEWDPTDLFVFKQ